MNRKGFVFYKVHVGTHNVFVFLFVGFVLIIIITSIERVIEGEQYFIFFVSISLASRG